MPLTLSSVGTPASSSIDELLARVDRDYREWCVGLCLKRFRNLSRLEGYQAWGRAMERVAEQGFLADADTTWRDVQIVMARLAVGAARFVCLHRGNGPMFDALSPDLVAASMPVVFEVDQTRYSRMCALMKQAFLNLTAIQQEALQLGILAAWSREDAASFLHVSIGTYRSRLKAAKRALRAEFDRLRLRGERGGGKGGESAERGDLGPLVPSLCGTERVHQVEDDRATLRMVG